MSSWLVASAGARVLVRGAFGECSYMQGDPHEPLLLAGTGTGLAPLLGVLRSALAAGHQGPIRLYHGARTQGELYQAESLRNLERRHANLTVTLSVAEGSAAPVGAELRVGRLEDAVFADLLQLRGYRLYLCGKPQVVHALRKRAFLAGAALDRIHADAFVAASAAQDSSAAGVERPIAKAASER
jgi:NAD(P)H-flavin reductase